MSVRRARAGRPGRVAAVEVWSIVVAAGSGHRFGGPKQLVELAGRRVVDRSVGAMARVSAGVVVVGAPDQLEELEGSGADVVVPGGATRSASVRAGLDAVPSSASHVLVHDAARPLVPDAVCDRVIAALEDGADGVVPVVPVTDSLRSVDGVPVDRAGLVAVQTPQGFRLEALLAAHAGDGDATDDATLVSGLGGDVRHVDGDPVNLKITGPLDVRIAEVLLDD